MPKITKSFEITASSDILMRRFERMLAMLHFNSGYGHSGIFAMPLDGDGSEKIEIKGLDKALGYEVDAIGGVGYDIEIAGDNSYFGRFTDKNRQNYYYTGPAANLYKNGDLIKTVPSCDWGHEKNGSNKD